MCLKIKENLFHKFSTICYCYSDKWRQSVERSFQSNGKWTL